LYKATVLYGHPRDPVAFDRHYWEVHIPLAAKMQGIMYWTITKFDCGPGGERPAYYLAAELHAASRAALLAAFDSPDGRAAAADVAQFADGGVSFLFGDQQEVPTS
jgi:uncharacterized protein (TIGR02118 family)